MAQRRCVLLHLRTRLGDEFFLQVAAFVPMSCQLGLSDAEEAELQSFFDKVCVSTVCTIG